jgi:hypothetical protein
MRDDAPAEPGARARKDGFPVTRPRVWLMVSVSFLILTTVYTAPLVFAPCTTIEWGRGDPLLNAYLVNWGGHALLSRRASVFDANFYHPSLNTLSLSDHLLSVSWPLAPLALAGEPLLTYNVSVFLSFFLSACLFFAYLRFTGLGVLAAWVGGVLFGFMPWRYGQLGHAQLGYTWWIPLTLLAFEAWLRSPRRKLAAALGVSFAFVFLSSAYHGFFFGIFLLIYAGGRLFSLRSALRVLGPGQLALHMAVGALALAVVLGPSFLAYRRMTQQLPKVNPIEELVRRGADSLDYLNPPSLSVVWGRFSRRGHPYSDIPWEMHLFPGAMALAGLMAFPVLARRGQRFYPVGVALGLAGIALFLVSLGPTLHAGATVLPLPAPYRWLYHGIPGFQSMRVPARASFFVGLAGAALAAAALGIVLARLGKHLRRLVATIAVAAALLDTAPGKLPYRVPEDYVRLRRAMLATVAESAPGSDLVLPICDPLNYAAPLASVGSYRPLLNGKSGYLLPPNGRIFDLLSERPFGSDQVEVLRTFRVTRLLLDRRRLGAGFESEILSALGSRAQIVHEGEEICVYRIAWP